MPRLSRGVPTVQNQLDRTRAVLERTLRTLARDAETVANKLQTAAEDGWHTYVLRGDLDEDLEDLIRDVSDPDRDDMLLDLAHKLRLLLTSIQPPKEK